MPSTICSICRKNCSREPEDAIALERKKENSWQGSGVSGLTYICLRYLCMSKNSHCLVFHVKIHLFNLWFQVMVQLFSWYRLSQRWEQRRESSSQVFSPSIQSVPFIHRIEKKLLLTNQKHKLLRKAAVVNMKEVSRRLGDWQIFFKKIISHPNRESPEVS